MREPANESLLTDVSGFAPTVARSSYRSPLRSVWRGRAVASSGLDMGHKRMGGHRSRVYPRSAFNVRKSGRPDLRVRDAAHEGCGIWVGSRSRLLTMRP